MLVAASLFSQIEIIDSAEHEWVEPEVVVSRETEPPSPLTEHERLEHMSSRGEIRSMTMEITAYHMGTTTATGTPVRVGVVAVDPDIIPFGSLLYITGVGYVIAEDRDDETGYVLDLYLDSYDNAIQWGRQHRKVYIVRMGY